MGPDTHYLVTISNMVYTVLQHTHPIPHTSHLIVVIDSLHIGRKGFYLQ